MSELLGCGHDLRLTLDVVRRCATLTTARIGETNGLVGSVRALRLDLPLRDDVAFIARGRRRAPFASGRFAATFEALAKASSAARYTLRASSGVAAPPTNRSRPSRPRPSHSMTMMSRSPFDVIANGAFETLGPGGLRLLPFDLWVAFAMGVHLLRGSFVSWPVQSVRAFVWRAV